MDRYDEPFDVLVRPIDVDPQLEAIWVHGYGNCHLFGLTAEEHDKFAEWWAWSHQTMSPFRVNCPHPIHLDQALTPTLVIGVDPRDYRKFYVFCTAGCGIQIKPYFEYRADEDWEFTNLQWVLGAPT